MLWGPDKGLQNQFYGKLVVIKNKQNLHIIQSGVIFKTQPKAKKISPSTVHSARMQREQGRKQIPAALEKAGKYPKKIGENYVRLAEFNHQ